MVEGSDVGGSEVGWRVVEVSEVHVRGCEVGGSDG